MLSLKSFNSNACSLACALLVVGALCVAPSFAWADEADEPSVDSPQIETASQNATESDEAVEELEATEPLEASDETEPVEAEAAPVTEEEIAAPEEPAAEELQVQDDPLAASIGMSASSIVVGNSVTLSGQASGGSGAYTYKFVWSRNKSWANGQWGVIRDFESGGEVTWTPDLPGTYTIYLDVADDSGASLTITGTVSVSDRGAWKYVSLAPDVPELLTTSSVFFRADVSGDIEGATYKFVWSRYGSWADGQWGVFQESNSPDAEFIPPAGSGTYTIYCDVTVGSKTETKTAKVAVINAWHSPELSGPANVIAGETAQLEAVVQGNTEGLTYKFVWTKNGSWKNGEWGVIQETSSETTASWTPSSPGTYIIYLDVIDQFGVAKTVTQKFVVKEAGWFDVLGLEASNYAPGISEQIELNTLVSGLTDGLTYKYVWQRKGSWADGDWGVLQPASADAQSITTSLNTLGDLVIYVDVSNGTTTKTYKQEIRVEGEKWYYDGAEVTLSSNSSGNILVATSGNNSQLEYKFVWQRNGSWANGQWGVIRDFSGENNVDFSFDANGTYTLYCDIRDSAGNIVTKTVDYLPGDVPLAFEYASLSRESIQLGDSVEIRVSAAAGSGVPLTYKFVWMRDNWNSGNWGVIAEGDQTTATFVPSKVSTYSIYCDVFTADGVQLTRTLSLPVWKLNGLNISRFGSSLIVSPDMGAPASDLRYTYTYTQGNSDEKHIMAAYTASTSVYQSVEFRPGYNVTVDVLDSNGNVVASASDTFDMTLSGIDELDKKLDSLIRTYDTLWKAYVYVADFRYISGSKEPTGNWSPGFALEMLNNNGGNCYRYAALLEWMARAMGYEAKAISGYLPRLLGGYSPHGWTEIYIDGKTYICDSESYHEYRNRDFFLKTYANAPVEYVF